MPCPVPCGKADLTGLIQNVVECMCPPGGALDGKNGILALSISDATDLQLSNVCASAKAVSIVGKRAGDGIEIARSAVEISRHAESQSGQSITLALEAKESGDRTREQLIYNEGELASLNEELKREGKRLNKIEECSVRASLAAMEAGRMAAESQEAANNAEKIAREFTERTCVLEEMTTELDKKAASTIQDFAETRANLAQIEAKV